VRFLKFDKCPKLKSITGETAEFLIIATGHDGITIDVDVEELSTDSVIRMTDRTSRSLLILSFRNQTVDVNELKTAAHDLYFDTCTVLNLQNITSINLKLIRCHFEQFTAPVHNLWIEEYKDVFDISGFTLGQLNLVNVNFTGTINAQRLYVCNNKDRIYDVLRTFAGSELSIACSDPLDITSLNESVRDLSFRDCPLVNLNCTCNIRELTLDSCLSFTIGPGVTTENMSVNYCYIKVVNLPHIHNNAYITSCDKLTTIVDQYTHHHNIYVNNCQLLTTVTSTANVVIEDCRWFNPAADLLGFVIKCQKLFNKQIKRRRIYRRVALETVLCTDVARFVSEF
jgi:hypothetical protein